MLHTSKAQVKRDLLREAEALIEEMLKWDVEHPGSDFAAQEQLLLQLRQRFGQRIAEALLKIQKQRAPIDPRCPKCGGALIDKGLKGRWLESLLGNLSCERAYYYCPVCRAGQYPLDAQLQLPALHYSEGVVKELMWLSGQTLTYAEAVATLNRLTDATLSKSSGWRLVQAWGAQLGAEFAAEEAACKAEAREWRTPGAAPAPDARQGVSADGGMLYILDEGWKEFKVGCVFDVELETRPDPRTQELTEYGHATQLSYTAHLGDAETLGWQWWTEAQRRGWQDTADAIVIGDGAPWIWNLRDMHFPHTEMVVDWYHATEHLGAVKQLLYPEGEGGATRWYNQQEQALYQGHADTVATAITDAVPQHPEHAETLQREAGYFLNNQRRMAYQRLREDGWPIGSGMVESGVKRFKARFDGAGMRWSRQGAENLLPVRAAVLSGYARFEQLWDRARAA